MGTMAKVGGLLFAIMVLSTWTTAPAGAEIRGITIVPKDQAIADSPAEESLVERTAPAHGSSHALVIGINAYDKGWPRLSNATKDAELVTEELRHRGFEVTLRTDLDSEQLEEALREFFVVKGRDPEARLFIWFAGHGYTEDGEGYLVPRDAPHPSAGSDFYLQALPIRRFGEYMRMARAKQAFAVFDSCFAGTIFSIEHDKRPSAVAPSADMPVRQFLTSGDAEQTVSDDGTFRRLFLRALRGEEPADRDEDGYLTGTELSLFMSERMTDLTEWRQTPRYGTLHGDEFDRGDFIFPLSAPTMVAAAEVQRGSEATPAVRRPDPEIVAAAQRLLRELGHIPGAADGLLGPRTRAAIRSYQSDHGLTVDGEVSGTLLESLRRSVDGTAVPVVADAEAAEPAVTDTETVKPALDVARVLERLRSREPDRPDPVAEDPAPEDRVVARVPEERAYPPMPSYAENCRKISRVSYLRGRAVEVGGRLCYDARGRGYILRGSRYLNSAGGLPLDRQAVNRLMASLEAPPPQPVSNAVLSPMAVRTRPVSTVPTTLGYRLVCRPVHRPGVPPQRSPKACLGADGVWRVTPY
jgi:peptidoglycan hydrolase-like protein with peptidoglycan-binding domain